MHMEEKHKNIADRRKGRVGQSLVRLMEKKPKWRSCAVSKNALKWNTWLLAICEIVLLYFALRLLLVVPKHGEQVRFMISDQICKKIDFFVVDNLDIVFYNLGVFFENLDIIFENLDIIFENWI